jgi:hypothetical protein
MGLLGCFSCVVKRGNEVDTRQNRISEFERRHSLDR